MAQVQNKRQAQRRRRTTAETHSQPDIKMTWVVKTTLQPLCPREIHGTRCTRDFEISSPHTYIYNRYFPLTLYPNLKMAYQGRNM